MTDTDRRRTEAAAHRQNLAVIRSKADLLELHDDAIRQAVIDAQAGWPRSATPGAGGHCGSDPTAAAALRHGTIGPSADRTLRQLRRLVADATHAMQRADDCRLLLVGPGRPTVRLCDTCARPAKRGDFCDGCAKDWSRAKGKTPAPTREVWAKERRRVTGHEKGKQ